MVRKFLEDGECTILCSKTGALLVRINSKGQEIFIHMHAMAIMTILLVEM